jgi:hypothetical protein
MIASAIGQEPYAIDIRLPPGKDCIGKQAMEMEIEGVIRANAGKQEELRFA